MPRDPFRSTVGPPSAIDPNNRYVISMRELAEKVDETRTRLGGPPPRVPGGLLSSLSGLAAALRAADAEGFASSLIDLDKGMQAEGEIVQKCANVWLSHREESWERFGGATKAALVSLESIPLHPGAAKKASDLANTLGKSRIELRRAESNYRDLSTLVLACHDVLDQVTDASLEPPSAGNLEAASLGDFWNALVFALLPMVRQPCCLMHQTTALSLLAKAGEEAAVALCALAFKSAPNKIFQDVLERMALEPYPLTPAEFAQSRRISETLAKTRFHRALRYVLKALSR